MKKLLPLLTLTALLLCGCADMGDPADTPADISPDTTTVATTAATTIDRDVISNPERYSDLEIKAMRAVWATVENTVDQKYTINNLFIDGLGAPTDKGIYEFGDAIVCIYRGCADVMYHLPMDNEQSEFVLDYEFRYQDSKRLNVFLSGRTYTLTDAYDEGILTEEDIVTIWQDYK